MKTRDIWAKLLFYFQNNSSDKEMSIYIFFQKLSIFFKTIPSKLMLQG